MMENTYECGKILISRMKNCICGIISITHLKQSGIKKPAYKFFLNSWIVNDCFILFTIFVFFKFSVMGMYYF